MEFDTTIKTKTKIDGKKIYFYFDLEFHTRAQAKAYAESLKRKNSFFQYSEKFDIEVHGTLEKLVNSTNQTLTKDLVK